MTIHFPNTTRPCKAAQRLVRHIPGIPLAKAQLAIAAACGYRDWHDLERGHAACPPAPLDEMLTAADFQERTTSLCLKLAVNLGVADGTIQAVLPFIRLLGNRPFRWGDHEAIRILCWRRGVMPWPGPRLPGSTFWIRVRGDEPRRAYWLRKHNGAVWYFCDKASRGICATFEAVAPRTRMSDFVPDRLWLPYGWLRDASGGEILFSRDYLPLWRIRSDGSVERSKPSEQHDNFTERGFFAPANDPVWRTGPARAAAEAKLSAHGITALPMLADVLPILIQEPDLSLKDAAKQLG